MSARSIREIERGRARAARRRNVEQLALAMELTGDERGALVRAGLDLFWTVHRGQSDISTPAPVPAPAPRRPRPAVPRQLPPAPAILVGRDREQVRALQLARASVPSGRARLLTITGRAGVGKSALARRIAHDLAAEFPDGQLYLNLHGATAGLWPRPGMVAPHRAPARARRTGRGHPDHGRGSGETSTGPPSPTRSIIVVLDHVAYAPVVSSLIPATTDCLMIVTSRVLLTERDRARHLQPAPLERVARLTPTGRVAGLKPERAVPEISQGDDRQWHQNVEGDVEPEVSVTSVRGTGRAYGR